MMPLKFYDEVIFTVELEASNYIDIPPLPAVADVKTFIRELVKESNG